MASDPGVWLGLAEAQLAHLGIVAIKFGLAEDGNALGIGVHHGEDRVRW